MVSTQTTDAMSLFLRFVLVILGLNRFDLMIRFSPGGRNCAVSIKVPCTSDLRAEEEVCIFNYLKHQFV